MAEHQDTRTSSRDNHLTLWAEFEAARAAVDEHTVDDATEAELDRWQAAQRAIIDARPTDPSGLALQSRYLLWCSEGSDVSGLVAEMVPHVADQLDAMAGRVAP